MDGEVEHGLVANSLAIAEEWPRYRCDRKD
jgi:hypothetical protein